LKSSKIQKLKVSTEINMNMRKIRDVAKVRKVLSESSRGNSTKMEGLLK
jgi:hypothetical protein